ncbi:hypothetical protein H0E87_029014 [Populus deltoides]|uniref:Uncharacterized protein n=1 Tax=Populus deltoides TaxID=3696 RepID=A0A8T2WJ56_POPDE|nr:hypothetical protein H0E87_029014 [Populus deltoides]
MTITDGYPAKPLIERRRHNNAALMDTAFDKEEKGTTLQQIKFDSREIMNLQQKEGRAKNAAEWRSLPSSSETSSSSKVPNPDLPKMTPSRARPPESAQSVGCDDTGFTLVTRRKKKKDIPEMKTRAATHRVAPSFLPSS